MDSENIINKEQNGKTGGISVQTEHIFPIIKKWLYSEKDIFLREIISNAADALTKMKRLCSLGQAESDGDYKIFVRLNKTARTLSVHDNGIGMTEDELTRYLCQIALSGALEFIEKYEGDTASDSSGAGIIGHFGLGFYSSFMVSESVEVITKSYTGAPATHWTCSDGGSYEISESDRAERGTSVIMHITGEESEYLEISKIRSMLEKYCAFMPYEIYLEDELADDSEDKDGEKVAAPINTTLPLWQKRPSDCTDEEYREFYHKVFNDYNDPLFSVHINADYPLNFKGILFFPKLRSEFDSLEGQVKLYYNQVFVADNIKEIMPEYLSMLRGALDCPELPLNVSRSYLQSNTYVAKVSAHIVKKISDKLDSLRKNNREDYERIWGDIRVFIEYAAVRERKFFERVKDSILLKLTEKSHMTIEEYKDAAKKSAEERQKTPADLTTIYYTTDPVQQSQYISLYTAQDIRVAVLDQFIDSQFITAAESLWDKLKFVRVDSDISELSGGGAVKENAKITELFKKISANNKLTVKYESLKDTTAPAVLTLDEERRRMDDFMKAYSFINQSEPAPESAEQILILNTASPIYTRLELLTEESPDKAEFVAGYIYKLSQMAHRRLNADELNAFLSDSYDILLGY